MIVTADPLGDFNATSQILRYSALAREVAVPRIPSASDTILSSSSSSSREQGSGRTSPNFVSNEELDRAMAEITRLSADCHSLSVRLAEEEIVREELEMRLGSAEEKCLMTEQEIREECYAEMDERMEEERRRWQNAWDEQVSNSNSVVGINTDKCSMVVTTSTLTRRLRSFLEVFKVSRILQPGSIT